MHVIGDLRLMLVLPRNAVSKPKVMHVSVRLCSSVVMPKRRQSFRVKDVGENKMA